MDIDEADRAVARIKRLVPGTFNQNVLAGIGSFGAAYQLRGWKNPVLISSADGVGTKLKVAFLAGVHNTVGEDLVNHCVNDIMVQGADPLFFLDYIATGRVKAGVVADLVEGMARGCRANKCALIGGETAEMPGFYADGEYDVAGFIVGAVERKKMITGDGIMPGDLLIGLPSTGLHTNGYSLARKLLFEVAGYKVESHVAELGTTVGKALLAVHKSYAKPIRALRKAGLLLGAAHITGGGITDNTPRILPEGVSVEVAATNWEVPPLFELMRKIGNVPEDDWRRTFNLGIGMIVVVSETKLGESLKALRKAGEAPVVIGRAVKRKKSAPRVEYI